MSFFPLVAWTWRKSKPRSGGLLYIRRAHVGALGAQLRDGYLVVHTEVSPRFLHGLRTVSRCRVGGINVWLILQTGGLARRPEIQDIRSIPVASRN